MMSFCGQMCIRDRFVSPTTGATISSAQFGILLALLFMPKSTLWSRAIFAFIFAIFGTWIFVWFIPVSYTHLDVYKIQTLGC